MRVDWRGNDLLALKKSVNNEPPPHYIPANTNRKFRPKSKIMPMLANLKSSAKPHKPTLRQGDAMFFQSLRSELSVYPKKNEPGSGLVSEG